MDLAHQKPISLHPLTPEEALADLLKVKPAAKGKKSSQKPKAARRKGKKGSKRK
jgi:hypothetical protein